MSSGVCGDTVMKDRGEAPLSGGERRLGRLWPHELVDTQGLWPEQLGLDTCGECDVEEGANAGDGTSFRADSGCIAGKRPSAEDSP